MKIEEVLQNRRIIHSDPEIMSGVYVFVGTRVPLQTFFDYLEGEEGLAEFINDFPYLESQAVQIIKQNNAGDGGDRAFLAAGKGAIAPFYPKTSHP